MKHETMVLKGLVKNDKRIGEILGELSDTELQVLEFEAGAERMGRILEDEAKEV